MESCDRKLRRRRCTPALLLAAAAVTSLVLACPAAARPAHLARATGAALSIPGIIAVIAIAAIGSLALVLLAILSGRREHGDRVVPLKRREQRTTRQSIAA
jgi:hypothetical protein